MACEHCVHWIVGKDKIAGHCWWVKTLPPIRGKWGITKPQYPSITTANHTCPKEEKRD